MNPYLQSVANVFRQIIAGFLFTSGGLLAVKLFAVLFKISLCG